MRERWKGFQFGCGHVSSHREDRPLQLLKMDQRPTHTAEEEEYFGKQLKCGTPSLTHSATPVTTPVI